MLILYNYRHLEHTQDEKIQIDYQEVSVSMVLNITTTLLQTTSQLQWF